MKPQKAYALINKNNRLVRMLEEYVIGSKKKVQSYHMDRGDKIIPVIIKEIK